MVFTGATYTNTRALTAGGTRSVASSEAIEVAADGGASGGTGVTEKRNSPDRGSTRGVCNHREGTATDSTRGGATGRRAHGTVAGPGTGPGRAIHRGSGTGTTGTQSVTGACWSVTGPLERC